MSGHGKHRSGDADNKKIKPPKDTTEQDMKAIARVQGLGAKFEGKTPPEPKDRD